VSIDNVSVTEGNSGTKTASFQITLSRASGRSVTVTYETANQSAVAPADYAAKSATTTLSPGDTGNTIDVTVVGDTVYEQDESFELNLSAATHATVGDAQALGTITNDGDRNRSRTSVRKSIRRGQIRVNGLVSPAHAGAQITVRLLKKKGGRFVLVRAKRPTLGSAVDANKDGVLDSRYKTSFANPRRARRCRVVARFPGDADHRPSGSSSTFDC
jgi:hypothetical protein